MKRLEIENQVLTKGETIGFYRSEIYLAAYNSTQSSLLCTSVLNKAVDEKEGEPGKDDCVTENRLEGSYCQGWGYVMCSPNNENLVSR